MRYAVDLEERARYEMDGTDDEFEEGDKGVVKLTAEQKLDRKTAEFEAQLNRWEEYLRTHPEVPRYPEH